MVSLKRSENLFPVGYADCLSNLTVLFYCVYFSKYNRMIDDEQILGSE